MQPPSPSLTTYQMENSRFSSMNRSLCSKEPTSSGEESGWTMYFEDFLESQKRETSLYSTSIGEGSSMVSDAASCIVRKPSTGLGDFQSCKKLRFKKRKARGVRDDDSLEDTASSPVNSPKADLNLFDVNPERDNVKRGISKERSVAGQDYTELRSDGMDGLGFNLVSNDCTELKKRGLCLVHVSMLADYIG